MPRKIILDSVKLRPHTWINMYSEIADYVLEYSSLDPIWIEDENGDEVMTEEKQEEFLYISDEIESIMRRNGLVKEDYDVFQ